MTEIVRKAEATWTGDLKDGEGKTSSSSGVFEDLAYTFATRFGDKPGTNPEELIAAAHSSCFSMALSGDIARAGGRAQKIHTRAELTLRKVESGFKIAGIHLETEVQATDLDDDGLQKAAQAAKDNCPVSKLLKPGLENFTMNAKLVGS